MKDFDIVVKGNLELSVNGADGYIRIPENVKMDVARDRADLTLDAADCNGKALIEVPVNSEHIEIKCEGSKIDIRNISFDEFEIDSKGDVEVNIEDIRGELSINLIDATATVTVKPETRFNVVNKGKGNTVTYAGAAYNDADLTIEINGKNSELKILTK